MLQCARADHAWRRNTVKASGHLLSSVHRAPLLFIVLPAGVKKLASTFYWILGSNGERLWEF